MRQEVQVYVTIKLKCLSQRFEESDKGDRQMGFGVVHCCYYDKILLGCGSFVRGRNRKRVDSRPLYINEERLYVE